MTEGRGLISPGFVAINLQFALVTAIAALFFAFSGYLQLLGLSPASAGFILSADALAALVIQPLIAPVVHSANARRWLVVGSLLLSMALALLSQVTSVPLLVVARLFQGGGFICMLSALMALLVGCIPPAMSGRAFGWVSLVRLLPYALIPFLFDLRAIQAASFPAVLHAAAVVALLPPLLLLLPAARHAERGEKPSPPGLAGMAASLRSPAVVTLLLSTLLFFSGYATLFFYFKQFGLSRGIVNTSLFFSTATVVMIAVRLLGSWLFDRCHKVQLCAAGLVLASVCYALLPLCASSPGLALLAGFSGLGWGIAMPLQAAAMFDLSPPAYRAMNQNLLVVMMQGGFFLGPCIGGLLLDRFGYTVLFLTLAAATLVAGLLLLGIRWLPPNQGDATSGSAMSISHE